MLTVGGKGWLWSNIFILLWKYFYVINIFIFQYISNKMKRYTAYLYLETAVHVSGGTSTNHQEHTQLFLQHLVLVKPLLLPAAIVEEVEHVEQFPDINLMCNVASCWIYGIYTFCLSYLPSLTSHSLALWIIQMGARFFMGVKSHVLFCDFLQGSYR